MTIRSELLEEYGGVQSWFHYDFATGATTFETRQDVSGILDSNKAMANDDEYTRSGIKDEWWHFASIPVVVQEQWLREYGAENWPMRAGNENLLLRLLASPEWQYLKTTRKSHISTR